MELSTALGRCVDVNECIRDTHSCGKGTTCVNTVGGYACECPMTPTFTYDFKARACVTSSGCVYGGDCAGEGCIASWSGDQSLSRAMLAEPLTSEIYGCGFTRITKVELTLDIVHPSPADLFVTLARPGDGPGAWACVLRDATGSSPDGKLDGRYALSADNGYVLGAACEGCDIPPAKYKAVCSGAASGMTSAFEGQDPHGVWALDVLNAKPDAAAVAMLTGWELVLHGDKSGPATVPQPTGAPAAGVCPDSWADCVKCDALGGVVGGALGSAFAAKCKTCVASKAAAGQDTAPCLKCASLSFVSASAQITTTDSEQCFDCSSSNAQSDACTDVCLQYTNSVTLASCFFFAPQAANSAHIARCLQDNPTYDGEAMSCMSSVASLKTNEERAALILECSGKSSDIGIPCRACVEGATSTASARWCSECGKYGVDATSYNYCLSCVRTAGSAPVAETCLGCTSSNLTEGLRGNCGDCVSRSQTVARASTCVSCARLWVPLSSEDAAGQCLSCARSAQEAVSPACLQCSNTTLVKADLRPQCFGGCAASSTDANDQSCALCSATGLVNPSVASACMGTCLPYATNGNFSKAYCYDTCGALAKGDSSVMSQCTQCLYQTNGDATSCGACITANTVVNGAGVSSVNGNFYMCYSCIFAHSLAPAPYRATCASCSSTFSTPCQAFFCTNCVNAAYNNSTQMAECLSPTAYDAPCGVTPA